MYTTESKKKLVILSLALFNCYVLWTKKFNRKIKTFRLRFKMSNKKYKDVSSSKDPPCNKSFEDTPYDGQTYYSQVCMGYTTICL